MAKANSIELPGCEPIPILYEDAQSSPWPCQKGRAFYGEMTR